jgi:hypothetical protein
MYNLLKNLCFGPAERIFFLEPGFPWVAMKGGRTAISIFSVARRFRFSRARFFCARLRSYLGFVLVSAKA